MGRPSISEQRRIEIGRALQACMVRKGSYEATSVKDIAQEAGIATGLVHHFFTSKDEILLLMADNALLDISNRLEDLLHTSSHDDRRQKLHELLHDQAQDRFLMMLCSLSLSMPEIRELILMRLRELENALTRRLSRSAHFTGDPNAAAFELTFLLASAVLQSALEEREESEALLSQRLEEVFPAKE